MCVSITSLKKRWNAEVRMEWTRSTVCAITHRDVCACLESNVKLRIAYACVSHGQVHGECETIVTRFRPVPLTWQYCYDNESGTEMVKLLDKQQRALNPALAPTPRQTAGGRDYGERRRCI